MNARIWEPFWRDCGIPGSDGVCHTPLGRFFHCRYLHSGSSVGAKTRGRWEQEPYFRAVACNSSSSVFLNNYRSLRTKQRRGSKAPGFPKNNAMKEAHLQKQPVSFFFMKRLFCVCRRSVYGSCFLFTTYYLNSVSPGAFRRRVARCWHTLGCRAIELAKPPQEGVIYYVIPGIRYL